MRIAPAEGAITICLTINVVALRTAVSGFYIFNWDLGAGVHLQTLLDILDKPLAQLARTLATVT